MVDDLGINMDDIPARLYVDTHNIEFVRERGNDEDGEICDKTCMIGLKSGDSFQVGKSYNEMIEIWNK